MKIKEFFDIKLLKFLIVGVINTLVGAGAMFLLYNLANCNYWFSSACNYIAGGICSYLLNKFFTFKNHEKSFKQIIQFVLLLVICYLIAYIGAKYLIYWILADKSVQFKDNVAMLTGEVLYTIINYLGQRLVVFKHTNSYINEFSNFNIEEQKHLLDFHADDYGISKNSCNDILKLISDGLLDSISILPNMSTFDYAVKEFQSLTSNKPLVTIHLNLMEGHCCAPIESIPDLVDDKGYFKINWGTLFKWNYNPFIKKRIKKQLITEFTAQTEKCINSGIISKENLRFDSHQHTHMIPLVFNALLETCNILTSKGYKTTFIRNTQDPILFYYSSSQEQKAIRKTFEKINIIKCLILNHYSKYVQKALRKLSLPAPYLCGVFFSGHMDYERLETVLPYYCSMAEKQKRKIELLFHPGTVRENEISEEFIKADFNIFHLSKGREIEYTSIYKLNNHTGN